MELSLKRSLRRSFRLTKGTKKYIGPAEASLAYEDEGETEVDEEDGTSTGNQRARNTEHNPGSDADMEISPRLRLSGGSLGLDRALVCFYCLAVLKCNSSNVSH